MCIRCEQCGTVNPDEASFCKKCGGRLKGSAYPESNSWVQEYGESPQTKWKVLDSPDPFPDKAGKYKVLTALIFLAVNLIFWFGDPQNFFQKVWVGFLSAAVVAWVAHILICNIVLGLISFPLHNYKYWLPQEISAVDLARKIEAPMREIGLRVRLNPGFTGGILVGDDHILYQVSLEIYDGYFRVLSGRVTKYATYECIVRDTPRIAYAIQQALS